MGITVELWRACIGLFSGGRGSRPLSKASSTKHQPLYFSDTVGSTAKVVQGGLLLLYILKFLSSQDKTKFLKRTRNVGLLVILIAVLLHSLAHLLLLAGDVESNPGPRMDGTLTLDDLNEAHSKLSESWNRWFEIGQALNVDNVTLDSIRKQCANDNSTCFHEMLDHRLKSGPPLTWELLNSFRTQFSMQVSGAAGQKIPLSSGDTSSAKHIQSISPQGSSAPVNLQLLMDTYQLTTSQVDSKIQQKDIPCLAVHFDNVELYVDLMELTLGEQTNVRKCADTHEAMIKCLKIWKGKKKFSKATFGILLEMLVKLKKEEIASEVCQYLKNLPVSPIDIATPSLKSGAHKDSLNSVPTQSSMQETTETYQESSVETLKGQLEKESDVHQPDHPAETTDVGETSSGDEGATDIFVCPYCKECSPQQFFSEKGCPKKTRSLKITNLFPYLDVSGLADENVIYLEEKLISDTRDIMIKFSNFSVYIRKSLEGQDTLNNLRDRILSSIASLKDQNVSGFDTAHEELILATESFAKIFSILRVYNYISFLNYQIIEQLIQDHGTDDDHKRLCQYIANLNIFCQRNVFEVPWSAFSLRKSRKTAKMFALKCTEAALSLGRVRMLQDNVAKILGLEPNALQLCSVKKGCVELHFLVSTAVAKYIFPLSPSQESALSGIGAMLLPLEEKENMQVTDVDLPILHEVLAQSSHKQVQQKTPTADDRGPQRPTLEDGELRRPLKPEEIYSHLAIEDQETHSAAPMDPDVTDPMSTQTQYPSTNATSAVTVASPALHNYSTVSNHPGIALSTHRHSHLPEPPGYGTSPWYGATNHSPLAPLPNLRYPSVPNASGHGVPQGYPKAYGRQYSEPRYLPPGVVPPTYGGHVPNDYHNAPANWHTQINPYPDMNTMGYLPQHPVVNTLHGNVANVHNPPTRTTSLQFPINASHRPPLQREPIPPAVEVYTSLPYNVSSDFSSPQDNLVSQSEESSILSMCLTDNLEQPSPSSTNSTPNATGSDQLDSHDTTQRLSQILSENDFKLVYEKLYPSRSEWSNFGIALGLPPSTIKQISKDHKTCEDCFYETLDRLFQSRELTWSKIIEALRKPTLEQNNLATEIESAVVAMDPPTPAPVSLVGNLSLEKLCLIPVDKVWYQLGLWLGVKEDILIKIKTKDKETKLFKAFLEFLYSSTDYKNIISQQEKEQAQSLLENYDEFIKLFPSDKIYSREVVEISKCLFPRLLTALVKVGKRDVAENICSNRGVLLTDFIDSKPPPECVVVYADYLKSKYREMSILPDPNWPPTITTKEHYTNLALIQKERNDVHTKKDMHTFSKDYAHGNIDSIIAKKTNIDLEEAFYPIINPKTNESRLTILMDGAPGVGKTTITRKVCIDWAESDVLPEYQLVVLVSLRELNILDKQIHLSDILPSDSEELLQNVIKHMMQVSGAGTLIIFDGFDELSSQERNFLQQSLVLDIIRGSKLHLCSVMITSRPYASQPLRSLSRVNRHIEVLGFTEEQIHDCVCTDIPGKEGKKLIQKLKERLDIGSLCYIPLNCRILLFVYKIEGFNLPSTITELYEIFLLHTIKRFAQFKKVEDVFSEIISAKKLTELPHVITVQLNALSKFALEGIEQGKLVFDNKYLKKYLSLGLLNSLHCFTTTGEAAFFQFLHLTIQEFLAARYVASDAMTDKERKSFMRSNIKNEIYRMTLLFLAGLTGFSFLSIGDSLLQPQSTFLSGPSEKERILFLSQIIYESKKSSNWILSHLNGSLDMSDYSLTEFDCLVLAHLMSNTPRDFVWEFIDLSSCGITSFSVFLETKHSKHTMIPGILVSKTVSFSNRNMKQVKYNSSIPIASVVDFLSSSKDSPLEELTLPVVELKECQQVLQLSQALINLKSLQKLKIIVPGLINKLNLRSTISKESFVLQGIMICSNSIMQLLKFASLLEIKRFEINGDDVFKDCSACGTSGEVAVKSLCEFLGKCKNIERIEFGKCCLNGSRMLSIVSSLSESLIKEIYFKEEDSKICDTELVQMLQCLPRKCTIYLKSKRVSIVFKANENDLDVSNHNDSKALGYETFLANIKCLFPRRFTGLSVETYGPALEYLSENTNLKMITLIGSDHYSLKQDKVALKRRFRELSKSLTSISLRLCLCCYSDYCDILEYLAEAVCQNDTFCLEMVTNDRLSPIYHLGPICNFFQCRLLQMPYLTVLSLNGNSLGADGTVALLDFLRLNPQLTVLKACNCELTDDLFTDTHYWETSSLKELKLKQNILISVKGWTSLLQSLRHNTSLIKLNCYCYQPRYFGKAMNEMLISNKCIQYLTTREYPFNSQYNTESLARALIQNLTLKEIRYGLGIDNVDDLEREIRKLKRDRDVTISPEWKLKIR